LIQFPFEIFLWVQWSELNSNSLDQIFFRISNPCLRFQICPWFKVVDLNLSLPAKIQISYFETGINLSKFGNFFKSNPCRELKYAFIWIQIIWFKFHSWAQVYFRFLKRFPLSNYWPLKKFKSLFEFENIGFKSFDLNPNLLGLVFQNLLIWILDQIPNFLVLKISKLWFEFKTLLNPLHQIQFSREINLKSLFLFKSSFQHKLSPRPT
jgi:hypothetical protein